jgi:phospholipase D1/2
MAPAPILQPGPGRTLKSTLRVPAEMDARVPDSRIVDPDQAIDADRLIEEFVPPEHREPARYHIALIGAILVVILGLTAAWHWSPLREWVNVGSLVGFAADFAQAPSAPLLVLGIFVAGGLVSFPLTVLVIVCVLVFGPWHGFLYSLISAIVSATITYALGHWLGHNTVRRFAGKKINELNRRLARRGLLTIIIVRIVPVAPFTVINMVAGASHIRFRDFIVGTAVGLLPAMVGISLFTDQLAATIHKPDLPAFAVLAMIVAALIVGGWSFLRWEEHRRNSRAESPDRLRNCIP